MTKPINNTGALLMEKYKEHAIIVNILDDSLQQRISRMRNRVETMDKSDLSTVSPPIFTLFIKEDLVYMYIYDKDALYQLGEDDARKHLENFKSICDRYKSKFNLEELHTDV